MGGSSRGILGATTSFGGIQVLSLLLQVSTMTEMKSYSQAVTGVSTATGGKWILSLGSGVFPEFCG